MDDRKFSLSIKSFCDTVEQSLKDYKYNSDKVKEMDSLTQDYLHMMEFGNLNYKERAKVATKLQQVRRERRMYKDSLEILQPLVDFMEQDKNKNLINLLRNVQGLVNKEENRLMNARDYYPKVISQDEFNDKTGRHTVPKK